MKYGLFILIASFLIAAGSHGQDPGTGLSFPPDADPVRVGKLISNNLLSRDYMVRHDDPTIHYAEICTADGAINFTRQIRDTSLFLQLEERYACFLGKENCYLISSNSQRKFTAALVVLDLYNWTKQQKYLDCVLDLVQDRWARWADPDPEADMLMNARYWSDDMYFGSTLETRIFKITGDPDAVERVTKWLTAYVDSLQLPNGLIKHTTKVPFIWGRGVGWAAVGLANALEGIPEDHPKREYLMKSYVKLLDGLLPYQTSNGLWRQLIDNPDAWEETSGSAMIAYSMVTGIRLGWLDAEKFRPVVDKTWMGLVNKLNENGELEEVCVGTNEKLTAKGYLDRPRIPGDHHGQAPMLWTAEALLILNGE